MHDNTAKSGHALALHCMHLAPSLFVIPLSTILNMFETAFAEHEPTNQAILITQKPPSMLTARTNPFSPFETRVIASLTFVATRCRHPIMRRCAIQLLQRGRHIENTRCATAVLAMAKRVITIEETGCVDAAWLPKPASRDRPSEVHRIAWAELKG